MEELDSLRDGWRVNGCIERVAGCCAARRLLIQGPEFVGVAGAFSLENYLAILVDVQLFVSESGCTSCITELTDGEEGSRGKVGKDVWCRTRLF